MAELPQKDRRAALRGYFPQSARPQPLQSSRWWLALLLWLMLAFVPVAHADPVVVTSGDYVPDIEGHVFQLVGSGFDLLQNELFFFPRTTVDICTPCVAGDIVDLSARFEGEMYFGSGRGTIDGVEYPTLTYQGTLDFRAPPVVFPELPAGFDFIRLTSPFQFTGFVRALADGHEVFAQNLTGTGTAGAAFFGGVNFGMFLDDSQPAFRFEAADPVPEPGTLMLVAIGAGAAAARRRRRTSGRGISKRGRRCAQARPRSAP